MKNGPLRAIFQSYLSKRGHKVNATLLAPRRITSFSRPQVPCVNREASRPKADRFYLRRQAVLLAKPLHHLDLLVRQAGPPFAVAFKVRQFRGHLRTTRALDNTDGSAANVR